MTWAVGGNVLGVQRIQRLEGLQDLPKFAAQPLALVVGQLEPRQFGGMVDLRTVNGHSAARELANRRRL